RSLIKFTFDRRTVTKDVLARYLWDYVEPVFIQAPEELLPDILSLITAPDATVELRGSLIADLYQCILLLEPNSELSGGVIRAFFSLLFQPSAKALHHSLLDVQLYNLIFRDEQPRFTAASIFPNPAVRERLRVTSRQFDSDRAEEILNWLSA